MIISEKQGICKVTGNFFNKKFRIKKLLRFAFL